MGGLLCVEKDFEGHCSLVAAGSCRSGSSFGKRQRGRESFLRVSGFLM
jgi:hypothetical protein